MKHALLATLLAAACGTAAAEGTTRITAEAGGTASRYSAGLDDGRTAEARLTVDLPRGDTLRAELVDEKRFGARGGVASAGYTWVASPDWLLAGTLALGHGGPIWADTRAEVEAGVKWLADRSLITRVALYRANYKEGRNDQGLRLSATAYLPASLVVEGGVVANLSAPGSVRSNMPFASVTWGSEGAQYVSATVRSGTEAYQALGDGSQLVGFHSKSARLTWRGWLGPGWGLAAQAERYVNPTYGRTTLGAGLFVQW